jgi:hypothetical protein
MSDRVIIIVIAANQFLLSLVLLVFALYAIPFALVLGPWGFVNAFALLSSNVFARKSALVWHIIFVGYVLVASISVHKPLDDPNYKALLVWAVVDLAAIFYLAKILGYLRKRTKSKT